MIPGDKIIKAFASYLPAEADYQEEIMNEEAGLEGEDSYYDEEEDPDEENNSASEDEQ